MILEETIVLYETAKLAKHKGFDVATDRRFFFNSELLTKDPSPFPTKTSKPTMYAPTQELLQKWLRETRNIEVYVLPTIDHKGDRGYTNRVLDDFIVTANIDFKQYQYYEEAMEMGLRQGLNLLPNVK